MLSRFEDLLFVWEAADLACKCHDICIPSSKIGEENFSENTVVAAQKIFYLKEEKEG